MRIEDGAGISVAFYTTSHMSRYRWGEEITHAKPYFPYLLYYLSDKRLSVEGAKKPDVSTFPSQYHVAKFIRLLPVGLMLMT